MYDTDINKFDLAFCVVYRRKKGFIKCTTWKFFVSKWELAKSELHLYLSLASSNKLAPIGMIEHHLLIIKLDVDLWQ